ncbi:hypothetical protein FisN_4Lh095 [Fistulifera solaris]|uniref:Uncharacterized protein n=1 Tax=Fistulifera solaris TaxID=1519565 RepID=A0A1Z5JZ77_FISSO|nr:hypothetical protein FisN_4Lh095 [Fistulifera solaris]|eukprot:GAX19324.1 hypothetical protein FisN_4Lh095 [Fistulifera solaris]
MVIPMRPGSRGVSSRPPLYSQLFHARNRTDLIDLTSMEEEAAPDESRGCVAFSQDAVETVREDSRRLSWTGGYPSEIHVTSPRENLSCAQPRKAGSPRIDNSDIQSHGHNAQRTEYGWSAHDYPSVVNVTVIDDVSEMGFQSQNGDQMSAKESVASRPIVVRSQAYFQNQQSKPTSGESHITAGDMLSRMKAITNRMKAESLIVRGIGVENGQTQSQTSSTVVTGHAIVDGTEIRRDHRDDLPLEVNIKERNDPRDGVHVVPPTYNAVKSIDTIPGEVNVSLNTSTALSYAQAIYQPSDIVCGDGGKESQEIEDSRDLQTSRSSQSSRSSKSAFLRSLSRRLSEKLKRNGTASKGFESLTQSLSEPFVAPAAEQAVRVRDIESLGLGSPEIIDLNDYEDNNAPLTKAESAPTGVVESKNEMVYDRDDNPPAQESDDQAATAEDPVTKKPSELVEEKSDCVEATENIEVKPADGGTEKECNEVNGCDIGDEKSLDVDPDASESDTKTITPIARGRERSRLSRATRKRKITGRSFSSSRDMNPLATIQGAVPISVTNTEKDANKINSKDLLDQFNYLKTEELFIEKTSEEKTHPNKEVTFDVLSHADREESQNHNANVNSKKTIVAIPSERKDTEDFITFDSSTFNKNDDHFPNVKKDECLKDECLKGRKTQPRSLKLNASDYEMTSSGSSTCEVEVEDLYVSSSNSDEGKATRAASMKNLIQGRSSEEGEDMGSVLYTNSSESDLEPDYDIYDQCVMPFIPSFLDTACAWLDGEDYGIRPQQAAQSRLYKLQKNKNKKIIGQRTNSDKNSRSENKTSSNSKGAKNLNLREVSRFARPRKMVDPKTEVRQIKGKSNKSPQTTLPRHQASAIESQTKDVGEGGDQSVGRDELKPEQLNNAVEPVRFTFSDGKRKTKPSEESASPSDTLELKTLKRNPSFEPQPTSPTDERNENTQMDVRGGQESPFRKKLQERMESIKCRDPIGDGEKSFVSNNNSKSKISSHLSKQQSPLRVPQDPPPSLSPKALQSSDVLRSPKQAEIVKISPKTKPSEEERISSVNMHASRSSHLPGTASSPVQDKQMATFRDGRLIVTEALPTSHTKTNRQIGSYRESLQSPPQGASNERPFDEFAPNKSKVADACIGDKLRDQNSKTLTSAAGGPETLQGIRARRRLIEQKQYASSSRNRTLYQERHDKLVAQEQTLRAGKANQSDSVSPRTSSEHREDEQAKGRQARSRSPSNRNERAAYSNATLLARMGKENSTECEAPIDIIDVELMASFAEIIENERNAALELVEKLRQRASSLQKRHRVRNRHPQNNDGFQEQDIPFNDSGTSSRRQEWEGHGYSISAA